MARTPRGRATVRLTSPDKPIFPGAGFTKRDLADYYDAVADVFLPQLRDRPITRVQFPDGVEGQRVFVRNAASWTPRWIRRFTLSTSPGGMRRSEGKEHTITYPFVDDRAGLRWMSNQAVVEYHTPQWRVGPRGAVRRPDRLVIDLDPGEGAGLDECARVALWVREALRADGLDPRPVTSGGKGLHLYADLSGDDLPMARTARAVHRYARELADTQARAHPDLVVAHAGKADRPGKVFMDWSQNHPARSTATPWTLRAKGPFPTVAAPRTWDEIGPGLTQLRPDEALERLRRSRDLLGARS